MKSLPGAGKTTLANKIMQEHADYGLCMKYSTDDFFMHDGEYKFDGRKLTEAHDWNKSRVKRAISFDYQLIIVDNTNTTFWEVSAYVEMALHANYVVQFVEPTTSWAMDLDELFKRNTHNVPYNSIYRMYKRWQTTKSILLDCQQEFGGVVDFKNNTIKNEAK